MAAVHVLQSSASSDENVNANGIDSVTAENAVLPVYFDEDCVSGKAVSRYMIWIDVMGSDNAMRRSLAMSANFVMKLHAAALNALRFAGPDFILYPMIDGIYCLATDKFRTFAFIERVFASLANVFIGESKNQHRFMVRGAVAYGPVVRGEDLSDGSRYLTGHADYCKHVVSLLTLSVLMILRLSVIEFRPWIVGRDKPTAGPESGYGCGRSEARSATMRPVCYLYSFSRTTLTAWSSTSLAPMLMAWSRQQLQREPIALAAPCVAS